MRILPNWLPMGSCHETEVGVNILRILIFNGVVGNCDFRFSRILQTIEYENSGFHVKFTLRTV